jgi:hypothetical protein
MQRLQAAPPGIARLEVLAVVPWHVSASLFIARSLLSLTLTRMAGLSRWRVDAMV